MDQLHNVAQLVSFLSLPLPSGRYWWRVEVPEYYLLSAWNRLLLEKLLLVTECWVPREGFTAFGILFHSSAKTDREHELWGRVQGLENKVQTRECWILLSCISLLDLESFAFFTCPAIVSWHFLEAGQWRGNQKNKIRRLPLISFAFTVVQIQQRILHKNQTQWLLRGKENPASCLWSQLYVQRKPESTLWTARDFGNLSSYR